VESNEFTEIQQENGEPVRVDQALAWETDSARAVKLALVEVQFGTREDKRQRWLDYTSLARSNFLGSPVGLAVR
jgi:hypothetical protein